MRFSEYLTGYEDPLESPLFDGDGLVDHPLFWPAFLSLVTGIGELPPSAFDLDPVDLGVFVDELVGLERWPVFSLPLADGMQCSLVVWDEDILGFLFDYLIDGEPLGRLVQIAGWIHNKPIEPGISWHELLKYSSESEHRWTSVDGATLCTSDVATRRPGGGLTESELRLVTRAFRA